MVAVLRLASAGVFTVALVLHIVGYATNSWMVSDLDFRGIQGVMRENGMDTGSSLGIQIDGIKLRIGLWKLCYSLMGQSQCTDFSSVGKAKYLPDWMKAVQALGILTMIVAAVAIAFMVYDILGQGKGDRVRLLPYFVAALCLAAGLLLLIAVIVYGAEFRRMMDNQISAMGAVSPSLALLVQKIQEHTTLGWSFALEPLSAFLMIIVSLMIALPVMRGCDDNLTPGGMNRAV